MSADNWATCPRCLRDAKVAANERSAEVYRTYGTVTPEEFIKACDALPGDPHPSDFETFREDYEIYGATTGEVIVDYAGSCTKCGLSVKLKTSKKFWPES